KINQCTQLFMNVTLPSRQSQNTEITTGYLLYLTRCSSNKVIQNCIAYQIHAYILGEHGDSEVAALLS
ncbi:MAG: hypothetical protein ACXWCZ_10675, partial [Flavisolibacter sp.]